MAIASLHPAPGQEAREELLCEILRIFRAVTPAADMCIEGIPISATELLQG